jgi:hypothetical protein
MIRIDRLRLTLPAGFERRAHRIARQVGAALADAPPAAPFEAAAVRVQLGALAPGRSDRAIAAALARGVRGAVTARKGR